MALRRILPTLLLAVAAPCTLYGQDEHPFIEDYDLTVLDGRIQVAWTMKGGSTCDGTEVERATDGVSYDVVHRIAGICGDPSVPVSFSWIDAAPPELSTLYFRIRMGFDGTSSVKQVVFAQLVTTEQRIFPVPVVDNATLLLDLPSSAMAEIRIHDAQGKLVLERSVTGRSHLLQLSFLAPGAYSYTTTSGSRSFRGRFVKD